MIFLQWLPMCHLIPGADPDESVASGREALDQWWGYPWYDGSTDGVRRVEVVAPRDWSWLWDWLPDWDFYWLRNLIFPLGVPGTWLGWVAWAAVVLLLAAVVYLLLRVYRKRKVGRVDLSGRAEPSPDEEDTDRIEKLPLPVRRGRADLLGEARRHYQQGNYAQAIVYLFSFQLVQLDRRQIIRLAKGKTNRQYLREVGPRSALHRLVEQTMVAFEDVFFGNHPLDRARFESCWSRLDEFQSLAGEGAQ